MDNRGGVIIITGNFPPKHNSVGKMIRTVTLASYLASSGYQVQVVAIDRKIAVLPEKMELFNLNPDVNVYFADNVWQQINQIRKKYQLIGRVISYVYRKMSPYDILLLNRIMNITTKIIKTNSVKNVIISTPPGKLQLLSVKLRKIFGAKINIIADYRDAWSFRKEDVKGKPVNWFNRGMGMFPAGRSFILQNELQTVTSVPEPTAFKVITLNRYSAYFCGLLIIMQLMGLEWNSNL
ncbi:MAG: hypothetical protein ACNA8K_16765 [Cyclonatronaceae bacterium]